MSIQTKAVPSALENLLKAKGQNPHKEVAVVQPPAAVIVENQNTDVPATPAPDPEDTPATPVQNLEPAQTGRDSPAWRELKAYHDRTVYELREELRLLKEAQLQAQKQEHVRPPKTPEEMKAFAEQYPEAVAYMETIVLNKLQNNTLDNELRSKLQEVTQLKTELKEKETFAKLLAEHPDAEEIKHDPKFTAWFYEQPEDIQRILRTSTDYKAISKQLTLYKMEVLGINPKETKKAKSQDSINASLGVDVKGQTQIQPAKKVWTMSEINQISKDYKLWTKYSKEIDAARREGRIDTSK